MFSGKLGRRLAVVGEPGMGGNRVAGGQPDHGMHKIIVRNFNGPRREGMALLGVSGAPDTNTIHATRRFVIHLACLQMTDEMAQQTQLGEQQQGDQQTGHRSRAQSANSR